MTNTTAAAAQTYTDHEATDEALLLLVRKLRRTHPDTYLAIMSQLPEGARVALDHAEHRADTVRLAGSAQGIALGARPYPTWNDVTDGDA